MSSVTAASHSPAPHNIQMLARQYTMDATSGPQLFAAAVSHTASPPITPERAEQFVASRPRGPPASWRCAGLYGGFHLSSPSGDSRTQEYLVRAGTPELLNVPRSSSRPSTASGLDDSPRRGQSTPDVDAQSETSNARSSVFCWRTEDYEIVIEELPEDDPRLLRTHHLLKPDKISEAGSERAPSPSARSNDDIVKRIEELYCDEDERRAARRKWNVRRSRYRTRSKRTWSESHGSDYDTDAAGSVDLDMAGDGVHRSKRRRSILAQRSSLIFDDPPQYHIAEVDEPEDEAALVDAPPPYPEVDWGALGLFRSLAFGILPDSDSDYSSSNESQDDSDDEEDT